MSCVNVSLKEFKDTCKQYDLSENTLRSIVYKYQNYDGGGENSFPSKEYIEKAIYGISMADASPQQIQIWAKYFRTPIIVGTEEKMQEIYDSALKYFDESSVVKTVTLDGKYRVSVATPYTRQQYNEYKSILENASRDSEGRLLAPNGKPSNLTEKQYVQVRTKAFKRWFGDWINDPENASKVVDENGEPLVVYHGSPDKNIEVFNTKEAAGLSLKNLEDLSIPKTSWFTEERIARETYSILPESFGTGQPEYGKTYPVFLNIKNPVSDGLKNAEEIQEFWGTYVKSDETIRDLMQRVHNSITENTDGFILRFKDRDSDAPNYTSLQTQYGIVDPNQAKSATDNMGTFKIEEDSIYQDSLPINPTDSRDSIIWDLFEQNEKDDYSIEAEVSIASIISRIENSEYSSIINLLKERFGNRKSEDRLLSEIKVKLINPLNNIRGYENPSFKSLEFGKRRAYYNASDKTIYINVAANYNNGNSSGVLLHEVLHAITVDRILSNSESKAKFEEILRDYQNSNFDPRYREEASHNLEEFIVNIWSDPVTIENLKKIKSTRVNKSLWEEIKDFFTNLFSGIFSGTAKDSLMAEASTELIKLLESPITKHSDSVFTETLDTTPEGTKKYERKTYTGNITSLSKNQIFVFGSNTQGRHGAGAAKTAKDKFGAKYRQAEGPQGQSYAIITKDLTKDDKKNPSRTPKQIKEQIHKLYEYAKQNPDKEFLVAYSSTGKNLNYYSNDAMAEMFASENIPANIVFEEGFNALVNKYETNETVSNVNIEVLKESREILDSIIEHSKETIKKHKNFDKEGVEGSHTYLIQKDGEWIPVDSSVTQLDGPKDIGKWSLPSTKIGSSLDVFVRDFFQLEPDKRNTITRKNYANLTLEHKKALLEDLNKIVERFDELYGKGAWGVETREFPIAGKYYYDDNGVSRYKIVAGTMDMIVYDDKGNFYIYDFKTVRSNLNKDKIAAYNRQLYRYKSILEANYPQLRGKIKDLQLIRFDTWYEDPNIALYTSSDDVLYVLDDDGNLEEIKYADWYEAPRLNDKKFLVPLKSTYDEEFKSLTEEEKTLAIEETAKPEIINRELNNMNSLYNNPMLTASERKFLSDNVMNYVSFIVSNLQNNEEANEYFFDTKYLDYDFTSMSRQDILGINGMLNDILQYIKEAYYNPENREDIEDADIKEKLRIAYDNWEELVKSGYARLITLEGITVYKTLPEDIKTELTDSSSDYELDSGSLEEKELEYWQLGIRNISAKSSLSKDIRRMFEKLKVTDSEGYSIPDAYGFNFETFVNSDVAVNSILAWVNDCTTIEEMEATLQEFTETNPWVSVILDNITEEPIRSQFFQNFRKDFTQYSITIKSKDEKGNTIYEQKIINTKGASKVVLEGVINAYNLGLLTDIIKPIKGDIEGRGTVNVTKVTELKESVVKLNKKLSELFSSNKGNYARAIDSNAANIVSLLNSIGISIDTKTVKDAFKSDRNKKNYDATNIAKVLENMTYLLDTVLEAKDEQAYNPILKKGDYNVYGNYKNIVNTISTFIQDSIESSSYENGKMHYSFTVPSYMGKLITNLKNSISDNDKFERFIQEEYGRYKWFKVDNKWMNDWVKRLYNESNARQSFDHKVQLSFDGNPYNELSELGYALSLMNEYFYDKNGKLAWYRVPILANKPSSEFIRFFKYKGKDDKKGYKAVITKKLHNVFEQEVMRIMTVFERSYTSDDISTIGVKDKTSFDIVEKMLYNSKGKLDNKLKSRIKNRKLTLDDFILNGKLRFEGSGAEFKFLPALNQEFLNKTELAQMIVDKINGVEVNTTKLNKLLDDAISKYMEIIVAKEIENYRQLGMFDTEEKTVKIKGEDTTVTRYKYVSQLGETMQEIVDNISEYIWNDMFATINIIQLTATDLAYYRNVEEFQKRYSQVHAPTMRVNVSAKDAKGQKYSFDGKSRTIYLKDNIVASEIIPNVTKIFEDKIATLSGTERQHMSQMKDLIISSFEEINVADAQAYSSPTSYRKKLGMQGKWTTDMETAYERIKSGNYNVNDLGIVWQPFKPFVYTQVGKASGATTMSELKVPVQNKNSEYLLLLADALMRSGNQTSKLTAIFDFMEESAYTGRKMHKGKVISEGVYNGIGIDTVQFESAVNSGSMGSIDLNQYDTYEDIKNALEKAVYMDNSKDSYDYQKVHEFSFEDYGFQQEVPAHFTDHEQLIGSQIRILGISDITPGTRFFNNTVEAKDLIREYQELHAKNIRESFDQLIKDLNIKGTRAQRNKALEELLQEAILKDQRYGDDLRRACTLDPITGEFTIPLYDPMHSLRIQQLINSIIKSRINKQKIKGGPVVQASVFGMSDDLKIVWEDKDAGKVKYFECYMPIPSEELEHLMTRTDSNGNSYILSLDEAIKEGILPEEMRKAIGYRIPTEDKYSMAPLYIKGFLPKAAGEAIMLPKEITTLAGSDFDIKLYWCH